MIAPQLLYSGRELVVEGKMLYVVEMSEQPGKPFMADGQFYDSLDEDEKKQKANVLARCPELATLARHVRPTCTSTLSAAKRASFGRIASMNRASADIPSASHTCRGRIAAPASAKVRVIRS